MTLHPPFQTSARLLPALKIGDVWISLAGVLDSQGREGRDIAQLIFDFPDGRVFEENTLLSGCQGFKGAVEIFESLLCFLGACGDSVDFERRTGRQGESADLFPSYVGGWAADNRDEIASCQMDLCEEGTDIPNENLIEE